MGLSVLELTVYHGLWIPVFVFIIVVVNIAFVVVVVVAHVWLLAVMLLVLRRMALLRMKITLLLLLLQRVARSVSTTTSGFHPVRVGRSPTARQFPGRHINTGHKVVHRLGWVEWQVSYVAES